MARRSALLLLAVLGWAQAEEGRGRGFEWRVSVSLEGVPLLCETAVCARHGRLLGVLGPSGAGKTTLLHALAGAIPASTRVSLAGCASTDAPTLADGSVALLKQDDGFFGMLTVGETLEVAAELQPVEAQREGEVWIALNRSARVERTLRALGLDAVAHVRVGDRSHRGISGGELRRLSVGCALLGDPRLLIADEPTSGLDSHQAERVVSLLRNLARERAIPAIATLHQPKSSIYHSLDDLLLLAPGGRVAYHGPTSRALDYFRALGFRCPPQTNPAEFLIDLVSIDQDSERDDDEARERIDFIVRKHANIRKNDPRHSKDLHARWRPSARSGMAPIAFGDSAPFSLADSVKLHGSDSAQTRSMAPRARLRPLLAVRRIVSQVLRSSQHLLRIDLRGDLSNQGSARLSVRRAPFHRRLGLLLTRSWRQNVRDLSINGLRLGACFTLAFLFADMFGSLGAASAASVSSRVELLSYASIVISMMSLMKTLDVVGREQRALERERSRRQYGSFEYLLAKLAAELPLDALYAGGFGVLLHRKVGLRMPAKVFAGTLALNAACCSALGLAIGSVANRAESSFVLGIPVCVVHMVVGVISPAGASHKAPSAAMRLVALTSPIKWVIRSMLCSELRGMKLVKSSLKGVPRMGGLALVRSGDQVLERLGLEDETASHACGRLGSLTAFYLLAALVGQQLASPRFQHLTACKKDATRGR